MKYMNMKNKYQSLNLQLFADDAGDEGNDGDDSGEGDDQDDDEPDEGGDEEKKFSQRDVDEAIKKRIARERRKWQREQQKNTGKKDDPEGKKEEDPEKQEAINKATNLEVKVACYEAGVVKDAVDDVVALARSYMAADEDLDLEDAIEKVVKKYPQFKKSAQDPYEEDEEPKKSWGERQKGKSKKTSGVEEAFLKRNPGLKID